MTAFWVRAGLSGLLIALASTIARRQPAFGALIVSLPLVSILSMIWLWRDVPDREYMARHVESTFWYILPSLPMFLLMPAMLRRGFDFWLSLFVGCVLTFLLYTVAVAVARRAGLEL